MKNRKHAISACMALSLLIVAAVTTLSCTNPSFLGTKTSGNTPAPSGTTPGASPSIPDIPPTSLAADDDPRVLDMMRTYDEQMESIQEANAQIGIPALSDQSATRRATFLQKAKTKYAEYPSAEAYFYAGVKESQRDDNDMAIEHFRKALEKDPGMVRVWGPLGQALLSVGKSDEGVAALKRAIELQPMLPGWHIQLGLHYHLAAKYDEALKEYNEALRVDPSCSDAYSKMAITYWMMKRYDDAWKALRQYKDAGGRLDKSFYSDLVRDSGRDELNAFPGLFKAKNRQAQPAGTPTSAEQS